MTTKTSTKTSTTAPEATVVATVEPAQDKRRIAALKAAKKPVDLPSVPSTVIGQWISETAADDAAEAANRSQVAGWRAHRTILVRKLNGTRGKVRAELKAKIAHYDALLADHPAAPKKKPVNPVISERQKVAAYKARRTLLIRQLKGTRGAVRAELQQKIAGYDALLADHSQVAA